MACEPKRKARARRAAAVLGLAPSPGRNRGRGRPLTSGPHVVVSKREGGREGLGQEKGRKKRAGGVILGRGKEGKEEMGRCGKKKKKREMGRRRELGRKREGRRKGFSFFLKLIQTYSN